MTDGAVSTPQLEALAVRRQILQEPRVTIASSVLAPLLPSNRSKVTRSA